MASNMGITGAATHSLRKLATRIGMCGLSNGPITTCAGSTAIGSPDGAAMRYFAVSFGGRQGGLSLNGPACTSDIARKRPSSTASNGGSAH